MPCEPMPTVVPKSDRILVVRGDLHKSDKTLCLYDLKVGGEVRAFEGHTDQIFDVAVTRGAHRVHEIFEAPRCVGLQLNGMRQEEINVVHHGCS